MFKIEKQIVEEKSCKKESFRLERAHLQHNFRNSHVKRKKYSNNNNISSGIRISIVVNKNVNVNDNRKWNNLLLVLFSEVVSHLNLLQLQLNRKMRKEKKNYTNIERQIYYIADNVWHANSCFWPARTITIKFVVLEPK